MSGGHGTRRVVRYITVRDGRLTTWVRRTTRQDSPATVYTRYTAHRKSIGVGIENIEAIYFLESRDDDCPCVRSSCGDAPSVAFRVCLRCDVHVGAVCACALRHDVLMEFDGIDDGI
jgi:hypothetical protein